MGKKDGFLLYERRNTPAQEPAGRIGSFEEFHTPLPLQERRRQAARCMNCGVPFCQSGVELGGMVTGCPLHNLIPEWNDMLYLGNTRHALDRLTKTNCFPEFTGRVCPALCEAACTCGLNGDSVTVRENELSIIEEAFEKGWMQPQPPRTRSGKQIAIVGSGTSGLAAAYVLNRRGHSVTVFEKADRPGGLLMYGIPNMKLDKKIVERRIRLMEAEGVVFRTGMKVGEDVSADEIRRTYDAVLLCCGAGQPRDLKLPGRDAEGVYFAVDFLTDEDKEGGYIGYYMTEDESAAISVVYADVDGMSLEDYKAALADNGATEVEDVTVNGLPAVTYVLEESDTACIAFTTEAGYVLEVAGSPKSDEGFAAILSFVMASIQSAEGE